MSYSHAPALAALASLLADETRACFCLALLDGRAWTAGELARQAGVARSTATEHLNRLVAGGLLSEERQGRHRYVRLRDADTAHLIEQLTVHAPGAPRSPRSFRDSAAATAMARARTCYDHLAGRLGVVVTAAMTDRGLLDQEAGFYLTGDGSRWLEDLGADLSAIRKRRRPLVRSCLDFTERRPHLAGAAGAELLRIARARAWVVSIGTKRALRLTAVGSSALYQYLGITDDQLQLNATPPREGERIGL